MTRTNKKLHIRALAVLLVLVNLFTLMPLPTHSADNTGETAPAASFTITYDDEAVTSLTIFSYEKKQVSVEGNAVAEAYQWQIRHPERTDLWVNIYDATFGYLNVTLALVKNMLDSDNTAQLRCRVNANGGEYYTPALTVYFSEEDDGIPVVLADPTEPTVPEETVPETTAPETTVPEETIPETTVPETTVPETTVAEETVPETTVPETTVPEETVPETTVPETTAPEETIPETTVPETTASEEIIPETTAPEAILSEETIDVASEVNEAIPAETEAEAPVLSAAAEEVVESAPVMAEAAPAEETTPTPAEETTPAPLAEGDGENTDEGTTVTPEFVTVTVKYSSYDFAKDADGKLALDPDTKQPYLTLTAEEAFTSYVATLEYNSNLENTKVPCPSMVGYDIEAGDDETKIIQNPNTGAKYVDINLLNITEDVTYYVKYVPADVSYTVRYYFQNIYDDLYVENTDMKYVDTAKTGTTPPENIIKTYVPGYTCLYYEPDFLAADGSTVFASYYERNYYLMEFDCDGGYGTDTLYVRYGSYISVPNPVKAGWVFNGWDLVADVQLDGNGNPELDDDGKHILVEHAADDKPETLPATMPCYNTAYDAVWGTTDTYYTIVYWFANLETEKDKNGNTTYSCWGTKKVNSKSNTELKPSSVGQNNLATKEIYVDFETGDLDETVYFKYEAEITAEKNPGVVTVKGDGSTVINVYYSRKQYTIRFVYAEKRDGEYWAAKSTGCGQYDGTHNGWGGNHADIFWDYKIRSVPTITHSENYTYEVKSFERKFWWGTPEFYYLALTAEYGANIEDIWPDAAVGTAAGAGQYAGQTFSFGSWASQCGSEYRKYNSAHANIVGPYPKMSAEMIIDPNDSIAQTMVAWWAAPSDNVLNHAYHIYYELLPGETPDATKDVQKGNTWYRLERSEVFTAAHNGNTRVDPFTYQGYTIIKSQSTGYGNSRDAAFSHPNCTLDSELDNTGKDKHDWCTNFYYNRNRHKLTFYNYNTYYGNGEGVQLAYGTPLDTYGNHESISKKTMETEHYPAGLEPDAYEFKGWYTTAECFDGTEVDWANMKMPDNDITVYAKWEPIERNVTFYTLYDDIGKKTGDEGYDPALMPFMKASNVPHGSKLGTAYNKNPSEVLEDDGTPADDRIDGYTFIGWFYMDEDNKKRFAPDSMEITRDLVLFAEWTTSIDTEYKVTYVLKEEATGNDGVKYAAGTDIADILAGHASVGQTKTFNAKAMGELKLPFQSKFFPTVNSHSILMDERNQDNSQNQYEFEYVHDEIVYYKVRYLEAGTNKILHTEKIKSSENAIVTEKFLPISNYIPQSYYIRKTLATDGNNSETDQVLDMNVITFYYVLDQQHGMYSVEYYLENLGAEKAPELPANPTEEQREAYETELAKYLEKNYTMRDSKVGPSDLGQTITAVIRSYEGFTYTPAYNAVINYVKRDEKGNIVFENGQPVLEETVKRGADDTGDPPCGTVDVGGLTIKVYYKREKYDYEVQYWDANTNTLLKTAVTGSEYFDKSIEHTAQPTCVDNKNTDTTTDDVTYEYYIPKATEEQRTKTRTIRAFTTGQDNPNILIFYYTQKQVEVRYHAVWFDSDKHSTAEYGNVSINAEKGTITGSTATPAFGFTFEGWYKDEKCTKLVEASWVTGNKLVPQILYQDEDWINHYYAKFEPVRKDLTIRKDGNNLDENDTFLFHIEGRDALNQKVDMIVSIQGTGSVTIKDLYCGTYTVTELTGWSWTYDVKSAYSQEASLTVNGEDGEVTFTNAVKPVDWLHGETCDENQFQN